jgi:hypothetical protein
VESARAVLTYSRSYTQKTFFGPPSEALVMPFSIQKPMAGLGLSDQKSTTRRDHAHRDRRGLFSIHTKYGLLNRLPTKVSFSIFD